MHKKICWLLVTPEAGPGTDPKAMINMDHVVRIQPHENGGSILTFVGDSTLIVVEPLKSILETIQEVIKEP